MNHRVLGTAALAGILSMSCLSCSMFSGGGRELRLTGNPDVPGAEGKAKVSTTDNGNTKIDLVVKHLAPPEQVSSGATAYVVWVQNTQRSEYAQNLGALKVDSDLNGSITAVTSLRSFDLYITAEPSPSTTAPTGKALLRTNVVMESVNEN
jgi:hypothetical protein